MRASEILGPVLVFLPVLVMAFVVWAIMSSNARVQAREVKQAECTQLCEPYQWRVSKDVCLCKNIENNWTFKKDYLSVKVEKE
tara:strand:+ start:3019 stop:3267 length:249 start_codon:yes stop_codon:yes gene_type:complete